MDKDNNKLISSKKVFKTKWFSIDEVYYGSAQKPYYRLSSSDATCMMAITPDRKFILVRQFRPAIGDYALEFPGGQVNENESLEEAVKREFKEETGFVCDSVSYMGPFKCAPSRLNNNNHIFFGRNARRISINTDPEEKCDVVLVTQDELEKLINEVKFTSLEGVGVYFLAKIKGFLNP
jgi:ADP-ribose pyrophosphatase